MICYFPEIYEDELLYSWFCRYYAHSGYPYYINALEDLLVNRTDKINIEFSGQLNKEARQVISNMYLMENLVLHHTMFPQYAQFADSSRKKEALQSISMGAGDIRRLLTLPTNKTARYVQYCPLCAREDREIYGEAYWHRTHNIRGIRICAKHRCKLKNTDIEISASKSPRLHIAENIIPYEENCGEIEFVEDKKEIEFTEYLLEVFQSEMQMENNVQIGKFLESKLEGTKYLPITGRQKYISLLFDEVREFYKDMPEYGIIKPYQMQKIFTGYYTDFYSVCQLGYFLNVPVSELINPKLPEVSQTELFKQEVARLREQGLGCHRIAKIVGSSPTTALRINREKEKADHDYSVRKGAKRAEWGEMDKEMLPIVKQKVQEVYSGNGGRPRRVAESTIARNLGLPERRFDYLPKCMKIIQKYKEDYEYYWARECVWAYKKLREEIGTEAIGIGKMMKLTNLRKKNIEACVPYLELYADSDIAEAIRVLVD